ncbi:tetratricopeptide repeat protein [Goodfellowiella coeruleoviolacea]|uniref:Tetratricopeptide repeat-containing protein n=1 Tax=Goodfellowiella coeruleoviolacea TaxID=334858 RepID=A0AAE3GCH2_9PSEU|nr:tetratricopeptide repeat protein [Goodfellowiella coeruleoviolacea]MCP2164727.1 Tetratricopeptide repeat-containing protein [Goodfellowiella coeruleoviolacea]
MSGSPLPLPVRAVLPDLALHTALRRGIDRVSRARTGGLFVLGCNDRVESICRGGYPVAAEVTEDSLNQLSKPDLAVVLADGLTTIVRINTELAPPVGTTVAGRGARHLTASRVAAFTGRPVVAVSEETGAITLFAGEHEYQLTERSVLVSKASLAVLALDTDVRELRGTASGQHTERRGGRAEELTEQAGQRVVELEDYLVELGREGIQVEYLLDRYCAELGIERAPAGPRQSQTAVPAVQAIARELDDWLHQGLLAADRVLSGRVSVAAPAAPHEPTKAFPRMSFDTDAAALRFCDDHLASLLAGINQAVEAAEHDRALRRCLALLEYFYRRKPWPQWIKVLNLVVLAARQLDDHAAEASVLTSLGVAHRESGQLEAAVDLLVEAERAWWAAADPVGRAEALNHLAYAHVDQGGRRNASTALHCGQKALELFERAENWLGVGKALNNLGVIQRRLGNLTEALDCGQHAMAVFDRIGHPRGYHWALANVGNVHRDAGRHRDAIDCYQRALAWRVRTGDEYGTAITRADLAAALRASGDHVGAAQQWQLAWEVFDRLGDPRADIVRDQLARTTPG